MRASVMSDRPIAFGPRLRAGVLCVLAVGCSGPTPPSTPSVAPVTTTAGRPIGAPQILSLTWVNQTATIAHEPPCCGDPYTISCRVADDEGDAVAVTVELRAADGVCLSPDRCWSETRLYAPGALKETRVNKGATVSLSGSLLTCRAVDSHGLTATATSCIPTPLSDACP
jgi:hypothetical protein